MSKKGAVFQIVWWSCLALTLSALLILGISKRADIGSLIGSISKDALHEVYSADVNADEVQSVEVNWHAGNVRIRPSDDDRVHLTQRSYYNVRALACDVSDGRLAIEENAADSFFIFFGTRSSDLELTLPSKQYREFTLKMTSGHTDVSGVAASSMELEVTSGRLQADTLQADAIRAKITSGNMDVGQAQAGSLSVDATSGDTTFKGSFTSVSGRTTSGSVAVETDVVPESLDAEMSSGKVSVTMPDNDGFLLNCKKSSGSVRSDFDLMESINQGNGRYTYGSGSTSGRQYSVKLTSGTFELHKAK